MSESASEQLITSYPALSELEERLVTEPGDSDTPISPVVTDEATGKEYLVYTDENSEPFKSGIN